MIAIQRKIGVTPADSICGPATEAAIRNFQRQANLLPDGIVGPTTWRAIGST